jgi:hypothetical protein
MSDTSSAIHCRLIMYRRKDVDDQAEIFSRTTPDSSGATDRRGSELSDGVRWILVLSLACRRYRSRAAFLYNFQMIGPQYRQTVAYQSFLVVIWRKGRQYAIKAVIH